MKGAAVTVGVLVLLGGARLGVALPVVLIGGVIAVLSLIRRLPDGQGLRQTLLLLIAAVGLGVIVAPVREVAAGRASVILGSLLAMLLLQRHARPGAWWRWCSLAGVATTAALAFVAVGGPIRWGVNPNALGGTLACLMPWSTMAVLQARRSGSRIEVVLCGLTWIVALVAMWLTKSVTAWIALAWPLALVFCTGWPRVRLLVWSVGAATVSGTLAVWLGLWDGGPFAAVIADRRQVWSRALFMVDDMPVTGVGLDAFRDVVPVYAPATVISLDGIAHAHNVWLQVVLDLGIVGALPYGWVLAVGWRAWRLAQGTPWDLPASGAAGVVLAAHLFGSADALMLGSRAGTLVWCGMGVLLAMPRLVALHNEAPGERA